MPPLAAGCRWEQRARSWFATWVAQNHSSSQAPGPRLMDWGWGAGVGGYRSPVWLGGIHQTHPLWKPGGSASLAFLSSAPCNIENLGMDRRGGCAMKKKSFCLFVWLIAGEGTQPWCSCSALAAGSRRLLWVVFLFPFAVFRPGQGGCALRCDAETVSLLHSQGFLLPDSWAPLQRPDLTRSFYGAAGGLPGWLSWVRPAFFEGCKALFSLLKNPVNAAVTAARVRHPSDWTSQVRKNLFARGRDFPALQ